ncbi:MAG: InlB B-repeat-containing protein, partial [Aquiluna sp.]
TRTGYTFQGWFESASGGTAIGVPYLLSDDTTLYAQWLLIVLPPANQSPVLAQAPLETAAPTPTTPTEPVSAAGGSVEGSNETLDVTSNDEDGSMMVSGSDWQLEVASNRVTSDSQPANEDQRLVFQPETRVEIAAQGLMPESAVALWVFSEPTFAGEVQTDSTGKFEANMDMPDGLAPGDHTLQVLSRDSKGRVITLNFPIVVAEKVVQKVNALSFKGFVALFVKGYEGQRLSAKVGKDWVVVPSIAAADSNLFRRLESVGSGVDCSVRMYIDYALIDTINLTTK